MQKKTAIILGVMMLVAAGVVFSQTRNFGESLKGEVGSFGAATSGGTNFNDTNCCTNPTNPNSRNCFKFTSTKACALPGWVPTTLMTGVESPVESFYCSMNCKPIGMSSSSKSCSAKNSSISIIGKGKTSTIAISNGQTQCNTKNPPNCDTGCISSSKRRQFNGQAVQTNKPQPTPIWSIGTCYLTNYCVPI